MAVCGSWERLFYPKNLTTGVFAMLTADVLRPETFLHWWQHCDHQRDFWVETPEFLGRIHVTPRRTWFDPEGWNKQKVSLKGQLLEVLDGLRESSCIPGSADDDAPEEESDEVRQRPQVSYPMATTMRR